MWHAMRERKNEKEESGIDGKREKPVGGTHKVTVNERERDMPLSF